MARPEPDWTSRHIKAVESLEKELNREICGVPTSSGLPCKKWPISNSHGRCRVHAPGQESPKIQAPVSVISESEDQADSSFLSLPDFSYRFLLTLLVSGIAAGIVFAGIYLFHSSYASDPRLPSDETVVIDPNEPDFPLLRQQYQEGTIENIGALLRQISEKAESSADRAEALYLQYVMYQNMGHYSRSLAVARDFLHAAPDHERRAEVLFGCVYLNLEFEDDSRAANSYYNQLKEEFPDSKWTEQAASYF